MHPDDVPMFRPLVAAMVIGAVITVAFLFITAEQPVYFTEIFFNDHQNLPEKVRLGKAYLFGFTVHSLENETRDYNFSSKAELFNMYDVTEGTYRCLGQYRDKVDLKWEFGELLGPSAGLAIATVLGEGPKDPELHPVRTNTTAGFSIETLDWQSYAIKFRYTSFEGMGRLSLVFMGGETARHAIVLSEGKDKVLFATFAGNRASIVSESFNFSPERSYDMAVDVKPGNVSVGIDGRHVLGARSSDMAGLRLGFEARNSYAFVSNAFAAKEGYSYKDASTIRNYEFDDGILRKERERLLDQRIDFIFMRLEPSSKPGIFDQLRNATNRQARDGGDFATITTGNSLSEAIHWKNYSVQFGFSFVQGEGNLAMVFEGNDSALKYGLLITEDGSSAFFARPVADGFELLRKGVTLADKDLHHVMLNADMTGIAAYLDGISIFNVSGIRDYTDGRIRIETEDSAAQLEDLQAQDISVSASGASDRAVHVKYLKKYRMAYTNDIILAIEAASKQEITNPAEVIEQAAVIDPLRTGLMSYLLDPTDIAASENVQKIAESFNPAITSKKIVFDGYTARISNWTDYTFSYRYTALDGTRQIVNSFQDYDGKDIYSFLVSEKTNQTVFIDHETGRRQLGSISVNEGSLQNVQLHANGSTVVYYVNGRLALNVSGVDFSAGQFVLGTESANAHFSDIYAINRDGQKKIYEVRQDPCQLQKVGEATLGQGSIKLEAGKSATINQPFRIRQLFDFAKISVNVGGDEIHFWVTST